ncbi:MAG: LemA family protein [Lachnospiraceae bacterium]|nr:LemA family protein [Lachnospiraceae bacterium]
MGWIIGIGFVVILILLIVIAVFIITTYNQLVKARNKVKNSFAQIDAQLQRRFDLLPNLEETVERFASHEKKILQNVAAARSGYMSTNVAKEKLAMNNQLTSTLKSLFVLSEHYPELKANTNFVKLQEELSETEDKVTFARQFYNDAVTIYNNKLQMFPANMVAGMFGFHEEELFNVVEEVREAPQLFDDNDLTDEERERYPLKCPHCMGVLDGTRNCPYCGARVV